MKSIEEYSCIIINFYRRVFAPFVSPPFYLSQESTFKMSELNQNLMIPIDTPSLQNNESKHQLEMSPIIPMSVHKIHFINIYLPICAVFSSIMTIFLCVLQSDNISNPIYQRSISDYLADSHRTAVIGFKISSYFIFQSILNRHNHWCVSNFIMIIIGIIPCISLILLAVYDNQDDMIEHDEWTDTCFISFIIYECIHTVLSFINIALIPGKNKYSLIQNKISVICGCITCCSTAMFYMKWQSSFNNKYEWGTLFKCVRHNLIYI